MSQRLADPGISPSSWSTGNGAQIINQFGDTVVAFGRSVTNAVGQFAQTDFTAVSGENYRVDLTLSSQNASRDTIWHHFRVDVIDNENGQIVASFGAPPGSSVATLAGFPSVVDGQTKTVGFNFSAEHSGNLRLQVTGTLTTGNTRNVDGNLRSASITGPDPALVPCFARGTLIRTDTGDRPIETLVAGDLVKTMDHGLQPIRWIGSRRIPGIGKMAPILIRKDTLGNTADLYVSPNHRMLLSGWQAEILFDTPEVLASAKSLVNDHSIRTLEIERVEYFHMMFDAHEIVWSNGAASESYLPGPSNWECFSAETQDEIETLFPMLKGGQFGSYGPSARQSLRDWEGRLLGQYYMTSEQLSKSSKIVQHASV